MRGIIFLALLIVIITACDPAEEKFTFDPSAKLRFSTDTLFFDTLFTSIGSITKRIKVFNDNNNAVNISSINLGAGSSSQYDLIVNGFEAKEFTDQRLLGNDSMLVLVKVTIDPQNSDLPFVVKDSIVFNTNNNLQDIKLFSWGQDAHFLNDSILACNTVWTADRPYLIFNSILIDSLCTLTIGKGTKIYSHNNSTIFVKGTLIVNGDVDNRVIFRNDRLDEAFENAAGQWNGIFFLEGSKDNRLNYAVIRNGVFGVRLGTPDDDDIYDLVIGNSIIENMSNTGIIGFTSDLYVYNTLVNNCVQFAVGNFAGGNYRYEHCTFANFQFDFIREGETVAFSDNLILADNSVLKGDLNVVLTNSIIWGNMEDELVLNSTEGTNFSFQSEHNIIRTTLQELDINNNQLNADPLFIDPENYNYRLDTLSPAKDKGFSLMIINDLDGIVRDSLPDIGAYERIE